MEKLEIAIITDVTIGKDFKDQVTLIIHSKFASSELDYHIYDGDIFKFIIENEIRNLTDMIGRPIVYKQGKNYEWFFEKFFDE